MESNKINELLDKYFEAETTSAEENTLKTYFAGENVAREHLHYKPLFQHFAEQKQLKAPEWKPIVIHKRKQAFRWAGVAAAVTLVIALRWQQHQKSQQQKAELAYYQAKDALEMLSLNLNKGISEFSRVQNIENTINTLFK